MTMNLEALQNSLKNLNLNQIKAELARRNLLDFIQFIKADYQVNWHHKAICDKLQAFINGDIKKLMVFMPPQTGKSEIVSRMMPAYVLGKNPDKKIVCASYATHLASSFNTDCQRIIDSDAYAETFPETTLSRSDFKKDAKHNYKRTTDKFEIVNHKGFYKTVGVGSSLTGTPVDIGIIDDPVKDYQEAISTTVRESNWQWYSSVYRTRLHNDSQELLTMTRWHSDDLAGRLLKSEPEKWEVLIFPALLDHKTDGDPREIGESLWESRHSKEKMLEAKESNPKIFQCLYQQSPIIEGGNIFNENTFRFYKQPPLKFDKIIQSWDFTFKDSKSSDFVVGQIWGRHNKDAYLIDQMRGQWDFNKSVEMILLMTKNYPDAKIKLIEDKANGTALMNFLKSRVAGMVAINPKASKLERAHMILHMFEGGNVYFPDPETKSWVVEYMEELKVFDRGKNDDMVDVTTQSISYLFKDDPAEKLKRFLS